MKSIFGPPATATTATDPGHVVHAVSRFEIRAYLRRKGEMNVKRGIILIETEIWFQAVKRASDSIVDLKKFETAILFKVFPRYAMDYNIPHILSDLASYDLALKEFLSFMHELDSHRITTINAKLMQIFKVPYIDQAIAKLVGGRVAGGDDSNDYEIDLDDIRVYKNELIAFLKLHKNKRTETHVNYIVTRSRNINPSVINTMLLVLFKSVEKPGLKTNFFLKCINAIHH